MNIVNELMINTKREFRLIETLSSGEPYETPVLRAIVGCNNLPDVVKIMRRRGWKIITTTKPTKDRDGHKIRIGRYNLPPNQIEAATRALFSYHDRTKGKD